MTGRWQRDGYELRTVMMTLIVMLIITSIRLFPLEIAVLLIFPEIAVLSLFNVRTGWTANRRSRTLVLTVCTSALLVLQAGLVYDLQSYYQGEINRTGWEESVDLPPEGTYHSKSLSNWYTVENLYLELFDWSGNVTFYIVDENIPQNKFEQGNCSHACVLNLRLPYRYSYAFVVANWTIGLYNPSQNESIHGFITNSMAVIADEHFGVRQAVVIFHAWPLTAILTLWEYTGLSLLSAGLKKSVSPVQKGNQSQDVENTTGQQNQDQT
ncbi:MAG: hypothetical protein C4K49_03905 [Candidatus Thorarchaeota archaeon]|nr:MAG: hypothetical protein C4K49_03905 [Candidatus Thorarchaeota archaeon]